MGVNLDERGQQVHTGVCREGVALEHCSEAQTEGSVSYTAPPPSWTLRACVSTQALEPLQGLQAWDLAAGFPEGTWGSWVRGMFCTRQALEKQSRRWAWCPLSGKCAAHTELCLFAF